MKIKKEKKKSGEVHEDKKKVVKFMEKKEKEKVDKFMEIKKK